VVGVASAGVAVGTQLAMKSANDQALKDEAMLGQAKAIQVGMINQQTGLRGYVLTGQSDFLEPYRLGRQQVLAAERILEQEPADEPAHAPYLEMKQAAHDWEAWADRLTAQIEATGTGVLDRTETLADQRLFDDFRAAATRFERATELEVQKAQADANTESARLLIFLPALGLIGLVVLLLLVRIFFRSTLQPLGSLIKVASALARGEQVAIPALQRQDEVGSLARALAAWERSAEERLALAQSMLELTEEVEMSTVLDLGIERLRGVLQAAGVVVLVRSGSHLEVAASRPYDISEAWTEAGLEALPLWRLEQAVETRLDEPDQNQALAPWADKHELGPGLALPLVSGGKPLGAVLIVRHRGQAAFSTSDIQLAQVIVPGLGAAIHVSRLFKDLTEVNADLERASRIKSQFVANMSHELRTPLNSVLGFAQLLNGGDYGPLNDRQRRYVNHIVSSGHHLLELINDVLDLSKIEAGKLEVAAESTIVEVLIEECVGKMRPAAEDKRLKLSVEPWVPLHVWADPRRLRQVLLNLLSNAIKFTPEGGSITVRAVKEDPCIRLEVTDTGIGIAPDQHGLIFNEFTQIDSRLSRESTGSGLGLPLSRRLVEIMGGSLTVVSEAGCGSTFTVLLPAAPALEAVRQA
jgi:signal transduction histidine kinase/CHASE3 domain sensor protein